jgi:putative membrane protein
MVLPGVSGSFLLYVLGQYTFMSGLPSQVVEQALAGNTPGLAGSLTSFGAFMTGAFVGVFSVAYAVRAALVRYREATLTFLVSLMVGALRLPATRIAENVREVTPAAVLLVTVPLVVGALAVFALDRYTDDLEY